MGNSSSSSAAPGDNGDLDNDGYAQQFDGIETLGYRVLGVQPNSPASEAGLVSFLDFIVGADERMLLGSGEGLQEGEEYDDVDFPALLRDAVGRTVDLLVWNIKAQEKRVVHLTPRDDWGGAGLLGVTIRLDNYGGADERMVRVLDVQPQSPAAVAGLVPEHDFLLGTTACALESTDVLASVLYEHIDRVVELYVYNCISDVVRVVGLLPTYKWPNGTGLLGAEVGTGYLHGLPTSCRQTIGHSIERKVNVVDANNDSLEEDNVQLEPHLEMEVVEDIEQYESDRHVHGSAALGGEGLYGGKNNDDDDHIGLAAPRRTKQPHELGRPVVTTSSPSISSIPPKQQHQPQQHSLRPVPSASVEGGGVMNATTNTMSSAAPVKVPADPILPTGPLVPPTPLTEIDNSSIFDRPQPPPPLQPASVPTTLSSDAATLFSGPPPPQNNDVSASNTSGTFSSQVPPVHETPGHEMVPPEGPSGVVQTHDATVKNNSQSEQNNEDGDDGEGDDEYTDDEEDTDYDDDDEDDEEEEQDKKPRSAGGFIRSFMPAPPKMHY